MEDQSLEDEIKDAVVLVSVWVRDHTDDWGIVKTEILNELHNSLRVKFTKRDQKSKRPSEPNELELKIMALWKQLTGVTLVNRGYEERTGNTRQSWWNPQMIGKARNRPYRK